MQSAPNTLPCFTTSEEYSAIGYLKEMYNPFKGCVYIRTPEEEQAYQKDYEQRKTKLYARLDEIFSSYEWQQYLKKFNK